MTRQELTKYIFDEYSVEPDYPFPRDDVTCVFRHADNRKWFGIVMTVPYKTLGVRKRGNADILNIKCLPGIGPRSAVINKSIHKTRIKLRKIHQHLILIKCGVIRSNRSKTGIIPALWRKQRNKILCGPVIMNTAVNSIIRRKDLTAVSTVIRICRHNRIAFITGFHADL